METSGEKPPTAQGGRRCGGLGGKGGGSAIIRLKGGKQNQEKSSRELTSLSFLLFSDLGGFFGPSQSLDCSGLHKSYSPE